MANDWLSDIGFHVPDLVAGFSGGIVNAFVFKKSKPWAIVGSIVVGGFAANYLSNPISSMLGIASSTAGFIVGMSGMAMCQGIIESAHSWSPFNKASKHE